MGRIIYHIVYLSPQFLEKLIMSNSDFSEIIYSITKFGSISLGFPERLKTGTLHYHSVLMAEVLTLQLGFFGSYLALLLDINQNMFIFTLFQ